jgi:hypothetical protein
MDLTRASMLEAALKRQPAFLSWRPLTISLNHRSNSLSLNGRPHPIDLSLLLQGEWLCLAVNTLKDYLQKQACDPFDRLRLRLILMALNSETF